MKATAVDFYSRRQGNCAEAVAYAHVKFTGDEGVDSFSSCGGGRAPGGLCGALHAALSLCAEEYRPRVKEGFAEKSHGKLTCREIRGGRVMPCADCIALAADLLSQQIKA